MKAILLRKADELSGACRNYFEKLKTWLKEESKTAFTNKQARQALREKAQQSEEVYGAAPSLWPYQKRQRRSEERLLL